MYACIYIYISLSLSLSFPVVAPSGRDESATDTTSLIVFFSNRDNRFQALGPETQITASGFRVYGVCPDSLMHDCMYVYMYACLSLCMCTYTQTHTHIYIYIHIHMLCIYIYIQDLHACLCTCLRVRARVPACCLMIRSGP